MTDAVSPLLIDTDVLIDYLRGQSAAVAYLESLTGPLLISAITVAELYAGVREGTERRALESFVAVFQVVAADETIAKRGRSLSPRLRQESQRRLGGRPHRRDRRRAGSDARDVESEAFPHVGSSHRALLEIESRGGAGWLFGRL